MDEKKSADGEEAEDSLKQALDAFNSLEETDEKELDGILELFLLGWLSEKAEEYVAEEAINIEIANVIANSVFETAKENKLRFILPFMDTPMRLRSKLEKDHEKYNKTRR